MLLIVNDFWMEWGIGIAPKIPVRFSFGKKSIDDIGSIHYQWIHQAVEFNQLYAALHIIEPRLNRYN
jgi:hypothetical protein